MDIKKTFSKKVIARWCIIVASFLCVVAFLPRENKFGYDYELGRPWKYTTLIASYDFPIYKSESRLISEHDSIKHLFKPYYTFNTITENRSIRQLQNDFAHGHFKNIPNNYLPYLVNLLHHIYSVGVLSSEQATQLSDSTISAIQILQGQEASTRRTDSLFTIKGAYDFMMSADTVKYSSEILRRCNLNNYINPNLIYDEKRSNSVKQEMLNSIAPANGMVQTGQKIIDRGEIIDPYTFNILSSLEKESLRRTDPTQGLWKIMIGQIAFSLTFFAILIIYLKLFRKDYYEQSTSSMALVFSLIALFPAITGAMVVNNFFSIYLVPYVLVPIFVRVFLDTRTAFLTHLTTVLLSSLALHNPYEFILLEVVAGLTAIFSLREITQRSQLVRVAAISTGITMIFALAYDFSQGIDIENIDHHFYIYLMISGALLLFAYPLMYLIEKLFGFTSGVTLIELSNTNNPLLRRMSKIAQGTFNHSMQVANLASEVANAIGAQSQLVRTGAIYHDIGKMLNPAFFTENQSGINPHDSLSEERSAQIIIGHVTDGLKLAEKYHIPQVVRNFIATHHGRNKVRYFYIQYCNNHPNEVVDESLFTYPGPNPSTREQAILMMADAIEASSRSLSDVNEESLRELVNRTIDTQMADGCFDNCPLTFKDIDEAKHVFTESLKTIYHTRIPYPELRNHKTEQQTQREHIFDRDFFPTHD